MRKAILRLDGERYGTIQVTGKGDRSRYWRCHCECGRVFEAPGSRLKAGRVKCRCQQTTAHGHARRGNLSPEYKSWRAAKARCKYDQDYKDVNFDPRWESFKQFLADMRTRPVGHTLDRINPFGGYTPENCRWAPLDVQAANKRTAKVIHYSCSCDPETGAPRHGAVGTLAEWAWYLRRMTGDDKWTAQKLRDVLEVVSLEAVLKDASPLGIPPEEYALRAGPEFRGMWNRYLSDVYLRAV